MQQSVTLQICHFGRVVILLYFSYQLYTGYKFQLKVCNSENCSVSEPAQLSTTQMPPTHVNPPRIKVQGE